MTWFGLALGALIATVAISYLVEAARPRPTPPGRLSWAPEIPIRYVDVDGVRLRYIVAGDGPPLVLLHTLRTQLDLFQKVIPALASRFRVYALDLPGHGYSDIPNATYSADFFVTTVAGALDHLDIRDATVVGESIGGSIALLLAARHHPRVRQVAALNPYDYAGGTGIRRSSTLANLLFSLNDVPVLGPTVNRLRSYPIVARVFQGGVYHRSALPSPLVREMYLVGNRPGYTRAFASLVRHWASWEAARAEYRNIGRPTLVVYGDHDWSHEDERAANARDIPAVELRVIRDAGHFLSLDAPDAVLSAILAWAEAPGQRLPVNAI